MKLIYQSEKWKRYSKAVSKNYQKRRLCKKGQRRQERTMTVGMTRQREHEWHTKKRYKTIIKAPQKLSFLTDPDSVAEFVTKLDLISVSTESLYIDMNEVAEIDYPTIASLVAVLYRSKQQGLRINGSFPENGLARGTLIQSGFLYTLFSKNPGAGHRHDINADNQLFTLDTQSIEVVGEIVSSVSQCVTGKNSRLPGLYTALGELMDNTATHAAEFEGQNERWWLSINYNRSMKRVSFAFIDYGVGIFTSLLAKKGEHPVKGVLQRAQAVFGNDATNAHLKSIVTESARTTYNLSGGHGEGIYGIYQAFMRGELKNLHIISNDAYGSVANDRYIKLKNQLNGTLYYWEVHAKNEE